ncbi:ABC transporter permease [Mucilaginibacter gossypiicola]|nr:ABC transporter permease [Mucilaginibacter gossypiicola]
MKLTQPAYRLKLSNILHFSPLLFELGAQILEIEGPAKIGKLTHYAAAYHYLNSVLQLLILGSVGIYLFLSLRLIEHYYQQLKFNRGDRHRFELTWLRRLLTGFGTFWTLWIPYTALNYFYYHHPLDGEIYYPLYLLFVILFIRITALVFLRQLPAIPVNASRISLPPTTDGSRQKGAWLKRTMNTERYYQDPELNLSSLAEKLGLNPHELSRIINTVYKKSFNDFVNEYRVREVIRKMQDPDYDHLTLQGIAFESGFNSKTTFHRLFKEMTGKSPAEYKSQQKKELPSYKLELRTHSEPVISNQNTTPKWSRRKLNRNYMFRNYVKMAWRNLLHNKVYSALNITGLATGMAVALLIGLWVFNQYSFDRFLPDYGQAYAVKVNYTNQHDGTHTVGTVAIPLADALRTSIPGIKYVAEADMDDFQTRNLTVGDKKLLIDGGTVAPDFLNIFRYPLLKGDGSNVLKDPYSIVLDQATSNSLFGNTDPIGRTIRIDNKHDVKVTGLMKNFPANSSFQFHFLIPYSYAEQTEDWVKNARTQWDNSSFEIFVGLQPGVTAAQVTAKIKNLIYENNPNVRAFKPEVFLHPLKDWHLYADFKNGKVAGGFIDYVRMFGIIGLLVLLIACINFVNLSTARSEKRAREVGVRKAIGSNRKDLIFQFLTESVLMTFAAFLLAVIFVQLALPQFNKLTGSLIQIPYGNPVFWCIMIGYVCATGLLAGCRPAFYLSSFNPVKVLKGALQIGKAATTPRKILVVLQFSCSVAFIISTVIIYKQIRYAKDRPIGYSADRLVSTFITKDLADHYESFKNDLVASGMVESVTKASSMVTNISWHTNIASWPGQMAGEQAINVGAIITDDNYFTTVGMKLLSGENFSSDYNTDTNNIIVNETAVRRMGLKAPINQLISFNGIKGRSKIIGVVKDALMESPFTAVEPLIFTHGEFGTQIIYRLTPGISQHTAIEKIGHIFNKYNPAYPFTYSFVNDAYDRKFNMETLVGKLAGVFAGLAIFVSCLGLFGLAAYVAEQRTKEIAVRKVLGASISQIWMMISADFILLVTISCVIASPVAWYFLRNWLQKYEYRITIGPTVFLLSAVITVLITLVTISFQAMKAALTNPVKSLRSE